MIWLVLKAITAVESCQIKSVTTQYNNRTVILLTGRLLVYYNFGSD